MQKIIELFYAMSTIDVLSNAELQLFCNPNCIAISFQRFQSNINHF